MLLDKFVCPAGDAAGFVIPLFSRYPGANVRLIQRLDRLDRIVGFDDAEGDDRHLRPVELDFTVEIGDSAIWAFMDSESVVHVGTREHLALLAPSLLNDELIDRWPVSAADLIRLCQLESVFPKHTKRTYAAMVELLGAGAAIWRDTDLILPMIRQRLNERMDRRARHSLSNMWVKSVGGVCHVYCPDIAASIDAEGLANSDFSSVSDTASAWGIKRLEFHWMSTGAAHLPAPAASWSIIGHGGVGRWTIRRMWNAVGPYPSPEIRSRMLGALEAQLKVLGAGSGVRPPDAQIVVHGSAPANVAAGAQILATKTPGRLRHVVNIRPLGVDPEKRDFVAARSIVEARNGPDYVWAIANHRSRRIVSRYDGLARSQTASRYARACITALADLCRTYFGTILLQETEGAYKIGLVGATRFLADMDMTSLLVRALYSMLSPEWSFGNSNRIVCLWPRPLDDGMIQHIRIGRHQYRVEMVGLEQSSAGGDIRCLAFDVTERPAGIVPYADFIATVMAAWEWDLRSDLGEELLFEEQGGVILMLLADTPARLDRILERDRHAGPLVDVVVTNRRLTARQAERAEAKDWPVIHHAALPEWLQFEYGEPGQQPIGGRVFPKE